jgi:hypothetical protein
MVTSMVAESQVARLQGMDVLVGKEIMVLVKDGVKVGVEVEVNWEVTITVGVDIKLTLVNSDDTVCAAWVKIKFGISVSCTPLLGKLHPTWSITRLNIIRNGKFFIFSPI